MKISFSQNKPVDPPLSQIVARPEDSSATPSSRTPFTDLMLHPKKLEAALKTAKSENEAFAASRTFGQSHADNPRSNESLKNQGARKSSSHSHSPPEFKKIEFFLEARFAQSVKLAADFTDWEKFPLDMVKSRDDVWSILIPLAPGSYSYRFIVDGVWCDDPHSALQEPNPFGTTNAVVKVA
jgi:Glycogen recognition site of AMP-activated protein kinase